MISWDRVKEVLLAPVYWLLSPLVFMVWAYVVSQHPRTRKSLKTLNEDYDTWVVIPCPSCNQGSDYPQHRCPYCQGRGELLMQVDDDGEHTYVIKPIEED